MIHLKVPDNEDVKTLKGLLSQETGCPPCQQELTGFVSSGHPIYHVSDRRRLSGLPTNSIIFCFFLYKINEPLPGKHFSLLFLPATPLSPSRTLEGLFELTYTAPFEGTRLASCVASGTTEKQELRRRARRSQDTVKNI